MLHIFFDAPPLERYNTAMADTPPTPEQELQNGEAELAENLTQTQQAITEALTKREFYMELGLAGGSIAIALLLTWVLRRLFLRYVHLSIPHNAHDLLNPLLKLLLPLLVLMTLTVVKPIAEQYIGDATAIVMLIQVSMTWLIIRALFLMVHTKPMAWFLSILTVILVTLSATGLLHSIAAYLDATAFEVGKVRLSLLGIIHGLVIFVLVFWAAGAMSRLTHTYVHRMSRINFNVREVITKLFRIVIYLVAFLITLSAMGIDLTMLAVFGSALGVGIGLGLQKITSNFVSGMALLLERSIEIGDLIEVDGVSGFVRQLNIRHALVETADGRELLIPNEQLMNSQVGNWTYSNPHARIEVRVALDFATDPKQAITIMLEAARQHPRTLAKPEADCFLREFGDTGLIFTLFFWVADVAEGRMGPQSDVMTAIHRRFMEEGIHFARPPAPAAVAIP